MSYPEPIPPLKGRNAVEFLRRLESFRLSPEQKAFYKGARKLYLKMSPRN